MENLLVFINLLTHLKPIFQSRTDKLEVVFSQSFPSKAIIS